MNERNYDLDERLIEFAALVINVTDNFPKTISGNYLAGQLLKSGTAPALMYERPMHQRAEMILFIK